MGKENMHIVREETRIAKESI